MENYNENKIVLDEVLRDCQTNLLRSWSAEASWSESPWKASYDFDAEGCF